MEVLSPRGDTFPLPAGDIEVHEDSGVTLSPIEPLHPRRPQQAREPEALSPNHESPTSHSQRSPLLETHPRKHWQRSANSPSGDHTSPLDRGAPGDGTTARRGADQIAQSKRRSQFYGEVFAYREPSVAGREDILRNAVLTAELKTNVIVDDEYTLLTSLSAFLAQRYARPAAAVLVHLHHTACLLLGGTFDPAYHLTVTALPAAVQPTLNKRNAALLQPFLHDALGVPPRRGVVRFDAAAEPDLACGGATVLAALEQQQQQPPPPPAAAQTPNGGARAPGETRVDSGVAGVRGAESGGGARRWARRKASGALRPAATSPDLRRASPSPAPSPSPGVARPPGPAPAAAADRGAGNASRESVASSLGRAGSLLHRRSRSAAATKQGPRVDRPPPELPAGPPPKSPMDVRAEKAQRVGKRRSLMQMFGRGGGA